jgi:predicted GNAT family N-acyltransferase
MPFTVRRALTRSDRDAAFELRREVFVREQHVPEEIELDDHDATADHVVAVDENGRVVATGRLVLLDGATGKVGRMAVARPVRGQGAGAAVLAELERIAREERRLGAIVLHAQLSAKGFYDRTGYLSEGEVFEEAGIDHVAMRKRLHP